MLNAASSTPQLLVRQLRSPFLSSQRYQRGPFGKPKRTFEDRNRAILERYDNLRLKLASPDGGIPNKWKVPELPPKPTVIKKERKLESLAETMPPYHKYSEQEIESFDKHGTYYDPLFNPHLHEERNRVNPDEEPFNAIYADSKSESANEYTKVRNITTPELWEYVERLAKIKVAPLPDRRKAGEPPTPMPSGFMPPPESPPDLPYFVPRTRNYLLPVYYHLDNDPEKCSTIVKQVTGDLWQLEEDLRTHLESLNKTNRRILTSVLETDDRVCFRGRYLHQVVDWLHAQGF